MQRVAGPAADILHGRQACSPTLPNRGLHRDYYFFWRVPIEQSSDPLPNDLDGPRFGFSEECFELGKNLLTLISHKTHWLALLHGGVIVDVVLLGAVQAGQRLDCLDHPLRVANEVAVGIAGF
jgi:hypothetical protein